MYLRVLVLERKSKIIRITHPLDLEEGKRSFVKVNVFLANERNHFKPSPRIAGGGDINTDGNATVFC